jgi:hypothetical protein
MAGTFAAAALRSSLDSRPCRSPPVPRPLVRGAPVRGAPVPRPPVPRPPVRGALVRGAPVRGAPAPRAPVPGRGGRSLRLSVARRPVSPRSRANRRSPSSRRPALRRSGTSSRRRAVGRPAPDAARVPRSTGFEPARALRLSPVDAADVRPPPNRGRDVRSAPGLPCPADRLAVGSVAFSWRRPAPPRPLDARPPPLVAEPRRSPSERRGSRRSWLPREPPCRGPRGWPARGVRPPPRPRSDPPSPLPGRGSCPELLLIVRLPVRRTTT